MNLPVTPPVSPMLAKLVRELPSADGMLYEPKWDGFRCIVFRDGDEIELGSRNERPFNRYFPELVELLRDALPERAVLDGEIVIATEQGLDFDLLQMRIHPAASRVAMLAAETPSSFVAFDLLADGGEDLRPHPLSERRERLERMLRRAKPPIHVTPVTADPDIAAQWFDQFEGAGLDGVIAKPGAGEYRENERAWFKVKHQRTADCVVAGFRRHKDGEGIGSLLLGLYDDKETLHHVGVASSFAAGLRSQLVGELEPLRDNALEEHPWREWALAEAHEAGQRMPGAPSRWNAAKDLSWEPLRIERVVEVRYEHLQAGRFRHNARFVRWRLDKTPIECRYDQLEAVAPAELASIFGTPARP
jgi:ATP-dependent DNA ligase